VVIRGGQRRYRNWRKGGGNGGRFVVRSASAIEIGGRLTSVGGGGLFVGFCGKRGMIVGWGLLLMF
jgi:hypothetical protein